jgi:hypothetical protein
MWKLARSLSELVAMSLAGFCSHNFLKGIIPLSQPGLLFSEIIVFVCAWALIQYAVERMRPHRACDEARTP